MDFKAAARLVLEEVGHPLHYTDITETAFESGYLNIHSRTPHNTMRARLSVAVRDNEESPSSRLLPASTALEAALCEGTVGPPRRCCILVA
ncbi:MAG: winged helix-turn-helix domain-containing protein [Actinobacteria bacterium]|nr:winged helix-turn-helix domain-containing protein [Actinomycetota bacterium]